MRAPFWSDTFDGDLFTLVPEAEEILAPIADRRLWTTCHAPMHGRINHPTAWQTTHGLAAFFSTDPRRPSNPPPYVTSAPVVECTVEEAVRDLFVHDLVMVVDGAVIARFDEWAPDMLDLLYRSRRGQAEDTAAKRLIYAERIRRLVMRLTPRLPSEQRAPSPS